jgi:hypothetical protein
VLQGEPVQKLHGDEGLLAALADLVDGADIWMVECGCRTSLAPKSFQGLRVQRQFIGQEFQGYQSAKLGVFGLVNHAHAAATQFIDDAVVRDGLADHGWRTAPGEAY